MPATRLLSTMVATWNNVATTFTGLKLNVTDTASAAGSLLMDLQVGGVSFASVNKAGSITAAASLTATAGYVRALSNSGQFQLGASADVILARDAANTLALRNGVNAQRYNLYETYTDASNYSQMFLLATGSKFTLGTAALGTGSVRPLQFNVAATDIFQITTSGNLSWNTDNIYDIGASGANRPRNLFVAGGGTFGGDIAAGAVGTVKQLSAGMQTTTARFRERVAVDMLGITTNLTAMGAQDNAALSSWQMLMGATADTFGISRSPPGSGVLSTLFLIGPTGNATLTGGLTTGGSVAVPGASGYFFSGVGSLTMPVSGGLQINDASATNTVRMTAGASNLLTLNGGLKTTGATFALQTATTLTDNAAAQVATMTNGPTAGNPTKWIAINDNGVTRYIPCW